MAERRMFAKTIIDSDAFLDMPLTSQLLYFHLAMRADDDGFINKPKTIMRMCGCKEDDMNVLIAKKFIIPFESGVVVIKHWRIHNYIRKDTYNATNYKEEKASLMLDENKAYTQTKPLIPEESDEPSGDPSTDRGRTVDEPSTQDRIELELGKDIDNKDLTKKRDNDDNYFNKKNTGENSNHHHDHLCEFFVSSFGRQPTEKEIESLERIYRTWEPDLCEEAIAKAVLNGQPNLGYVIGILNNWKKEGIRTYDDYAQRDIERRGI